MKNRNLLFFVGFILCILLSCKKSQDQPSLPEPVPLPDITTLAVTGITDSSAITGGKPATTVAITEKGILWGTDSNTLQLSSANKTSNGPGTAAFNDTLRNLQPNTIYYAKAYAVSAGGVGYGNTVTIQTLPPQPNVYMAGYHGGSACWWKNGTLHLLPQGTFAHSIFIAGEDVYVCGEINDGKLTAVYWKNGTRVPLTNGINSAVANSIFVVNNDVYIAGYELANNNADLPVATFWKNGVAYRLHNGTYQNNGVARSIYVSGNDVYVAGYTRNIPMGYAYAVCWKNGVAIPLTDSTTVSAEATSVFVDGTDVYVTGSEKQGTGLGGFYMAKYWKNGKGVALTDGQRSAGANAITVKGGDVYVSGYDSHPQTDYSIATYWKNGVAVSLTNGYGFAYAFDIEVMNNDVYVAGGIGDYFNAIHWKNGVVLPLSLSNTFSRSKSIVVKF